MAFYNLSSVTFCKEVIPGAFSKVFFFLNLQVFYAHVAFMKFMHMVCIVKFRQTDTTSQNIVNNNVASCWDLLRGACKRTQQLPTSSKEVMDSAR